MAIVKENIEFQRGQDPKDSMGIGNQLYRENLEVLHNTKEAFPWIEDNLEIYASRLTDLGVKLIDINQKTSNFFVFHWLNAAGGMQLRTINLPKEKWVNLFAAVTGIIREVQSVKETINFERGMNPKDSMDIGNINARKLRQFYDFVKQFKNFKMGEFKYPDFEFLLEDPGIGIKIKVIISKSHDDDDDFIYHSYGPNGIALGNAHFTNLAEFKSVLKHKIGYAMSEAMDFERGKDPKSSMKIGIPTWETLQEEDLIECLITIPLDSSNKINRFYPVSDLPMGAILEVEELNDASTQEWTLWYRFFSNMEDFQENKNEHIKERIGYISGAPSSFRKVFKFLPRSMNETINFERGGDPKSTMGIGKKVLIENWLREMGILPKCIINKDLTVDAHFAVDFERKLPDGLPKFIQFRKVYGGFNIGGNNLTSLRGCPIRVYETENYKGNFKCHSNNLTSLEGAPKSIDGNFLAYGNPGKFQRSDVKKVCKVKSGIIWGDEKINESMDFQRGEAPLGTMSLGFHAQVKNWFKDCGVTNDPLEKEKYLEYRINKDGTIDVLEDLNLVGSHIENFPYFIRFKRIYGGFYVANNIFTKLDGFPKEVDGDLSIYSDQKGAKKWKENEIRKHIKIKGNVWN